MIKRITIIAILLFPVLLFGQNAKDINTVIQKTIDLHALKNYYNEDEKAGETPLIIINDDKIPNNLIVFKFNKRVKIMTKEELETFRSIYSGNLDSYFVFENIDFNGDEVKIKASFRKNNSIPISVNLKKEENDWTIVASSAG